MGFFYFYLMTTFLAEIEKSLLETSNNLTSTSSTEALKDFFSQDVTLLLQKSLLSGEYYDLDAKEAITRIRAFILKISEKIRVITTQLGKSVQTQGQDASTLLLIANWLTTQTEIKEFDLQYITKYISFVNNLNSNLDRLYSGQDSSIVDLESFDVILNLAELSQTLTLAGLKEKITDYSSYTFFQLNMFLCYMDEYLEFSTISVIRLERAIKYLQLQKENKNNKEVRSILIDKAKFLIFKIEYRKTHKGILLDRRRVVEEINATNKFYQLYLSTIRHYSKLTIQDQQESRNELDAYTDSNLQTWKMSVFHDLNKIYHRLKPDEKPETKKKNIDNLRSKLEEKWNSEALPLFNKVAIKSGFNLLHNSSQNLEFEIEKFEDHYNEVISDLKKFLVGSNSNPMPKFISDCHTKISEFSSHSRLPDYYCYMVFLSFLNKMIDVFTRDPKKIITSELSEIDNDTIDERIDRITTSIGNVYNTVLKELQASLTKMTTHKVKPIYLMYSECCVPYTWEDGVEGHLFLESSYILPTDFSEIQGKISSWGSFIRPELNLLKDALEVSFSHLAIKQTIENSEKKAKENEFRVIQIVAMFVSIATFVLINVKIFDNKSGIESFAIILGLAACFFLFNYFFYLISLFNFRSATEIKSSLFSQRYILAIPGVLIIVSYLLLHSENGRSGKEFDSVRNKIKSDSVYFQTLHDAALNFSTHNDRRKDTIASISVQSQSNDTSMTSNSISQPKTPASSPTK